MSDAPAQAPELHLLRWQAAAPESVEWVDWAGESVLFHVPSGKTHFINAATARLLREVLKEPRNIGQIVDALSAGQSEPDQQAIRESAMELLLRLENLGLVHAL